MPDRSFLSIGDVLGLLRDEFPDVTISKIRFLESKGLLCPERTPSGYRKFYPRDVNTLRWVLYLQREEYLPLRVIRSRLQVLDLDQPPPISNGAASAPTGPAGLPFPPNATDGERVVRSEATVPSRPEAVARAWGEAVDGDGVGAVEPRSAEPASPEASRGPAAPVDLANGALQPQAESRLDRDPLAGRTSTLGATVRWVPAAGGLVSATHSAVPPASGRQSPDIEEDGAPSVALAGASRCRTEPEASGPRRVAPGALPAAKSEPSAVSLRLLTERGARANGTPVGASVEEGDRPERGGVAGGADGGEPVDEDLARAGSAPNPSSGPLRGTGAEPSGTPARPEPAVETAGREASSGVDEPPARAPSAAEGSPADSEGGEGRWTRRELAEEVGLPERTLEELARFGFLHGRTAFGEVFFGTDDRRIATAAAHFLRLGLEPRHLRLYQNAVAREASLLEQVVTPLLRQRNPEARTRAAVLLDELGKAGGELRAALLTAALRTLREL